VTGADFFERKILLSGWCWWLVLILYEREILLARCNENKRNRVCFAVLVRRQEGTQDADGYLTEMSYGGRTQSHRRSVKANEGVDVDLPNVNQHAICWEYKKPNITNLLKKQLMN